MRTTAIFLTLGLAFSPLALTESYLRAQERAAAMADGCRFKFDESRGCIDGAGGQGRNPGIQGECGDLQGANLKNADLRGKSLAGAKLNQSDLTRANLRNVNLRRANLSEANLDATDLQEADLAKANLKEA